MGHQIQERWSECEDTSTQEKTEKNVSIVKSLHEEITILNMMCTSEEEVKDDDEYMEKYYPGVDQIYNLGRLTLVSKNFIKWAKLIVTAINLSINEKK